MTAQLCDAKQKETFLERSRSVHGGVKPAVHFHVAAAVPGPLELCRHPERGNKKLAVEEPLKNLAGRFGTLLP